MAKKDFSFNSVVVIIKISVGLKHFLSTFKRDEGQTNYFILRHALPCELKFTQNCPCCSRCDEREIKYLVKY